MAKLIIDGKEHGIHAFVIQLRSLNDHSIVSGKNNNSYTIWKKQKCIVSNEILKK